KPLPIRSDEWQVYASFVLAQHQKDFPLSNEALGYGKTPLAFGLPTSHLLSKVKPAFWGYYFLDIERAFSWQWNFKIFPFLVASFLLLMLFTRNHFLLSLFGAVWLLLSSAIQWWSMYTELFTYGMVSLISFIYILYAEKPRTIIINGILLVLSSYSFAMVLYPAYQVPFAYFLLACLTGYLIKNRIELKTGFSKNTLLRILTLSGLLIIVIGLLYLFLHETKETIDVISNTVYPGKRNESGGNFSILNMFTDNFNWFMNDHKFPGKWGNICELSSFLLLFPLASIIAVVEFIKFKKFNPLLSALIVYQIFILIWILVGLPEFLAKITLLNTSPSFRSFFIYGFANVVGTIIILSHYRNNVFKNNVLTKVVSFILLCGLVYGLHTLVNKQVDFYFSEIQVIIATIIFAGFNWIVFHFHTNRSVQIAFYTALLIFLVPNITINPLAKGLSPYFENAVFKSVSEIHAKDPEAGWVVFGNYSTPNFLKAAGVNCFNGVQFAPPLKKLEILDPMQENVDTYNRYAHISFTSLIDGKDSIEFELRQADLYFVHMDPCSPRFNELGLKYIMFTYQPDPIETECMTFIKGITNHYIFQRNDL
ncbi:MAG TPA: hypothetical protein VMZ69_10060, partial [Saprospiraceae bacterium]|nr:hypothetical protein [Saprospiraceae bacterium]